MSLTKSEIALLLALCASFDQRTIGEADVEAWHEILGEDLSFTDARTRVLAHYRVSNERIMPSDILTPHRVPELEPGFWER